jgi:MoaA/NifB/PqqE/SkfB family radical SAM enzyme
MHKTCPDHGDMTAVVEQDLENYLLLSSRFTWDLSPATLITVTNRCNVSCPHCYFPVDNASDDPTIDEIMLEYAKAHSWSRIFLLWGGEPTVREDLPELIKMCCQRYGHFAAGIVTNGVKLADDSYLGELLKAGLAIGTDYFWCYLSLHPEKDNLPEVYAKKLQALENIKCRGYKCYLAFTINDTGDIPEVTAKIREHRTLLHIPGQPTFPDRTHVRVRWATSIWEENRFTKTSYMSQLIKAFAEQARIEGVTFRNLPEETRGAYRAHYEYDGVVLRLVACPTTENIDLQQLAAPPYWRSLDGRMVNTVHAIALNEGFKKGWFNGVRKSEAP